jgi:hypothetical protein
LDCGQGGDQVVVRGDGNKGAQRAWLHPGLILDWNG